MGRFGVSTSTRERGLVSQLLMFLIVSGLCGVLLAGLAIPFAGALGLGARTATDTFESLPSQLDDPPPPEKSTVLAADGSTLAVLFDDNRVNLDNLEDVAPVMQDAIVAIEDERFYEHGAMDFRGTMRAFVRNQQAGGAVTQGGSTITQQYVKLVLVENAETPAERREAIEETYSRKLQELRYAVTIEERMSKKEILRKYLNIVYFGSGVYGVEAAAKHFFSTTAKELTLNQAALLAGLVRDPNGFDPAEDPKRAKARRDLVLSRMAEQGMISDKEAKKAQEPGLGLDIDRTRNGCYYASAPFFCDYAQEVLLNDPALGENREERRRLLYQGGLTIRTTLDRDIQRAAEQAVEGGADPTDKPISAVSMVEPGTGQVKAMAQSKSMGDGDGETFVNFNVPQRYNGSMGWQPGSSYKPFVLAAAIDQGVPLTKDYPAPSSMTHTGPMRTCPEGERGRVIDEWPVNNSTDPGGSNINLIEGTARSVNTFYAHLEDDTGICQPARIATKLGATRGDGERLQQYKSFVLGVNEVPPLHMAEAYASFAARGKHCPATPIIEVLDRNGDPVDFTKTKCERAIPKDVADAVNFTLTKVTDGSVSGATGTNMAIDGWQVAGKTGTNTDNKAVWFMGYTSMLAAASVVATADNTTLEGTTLKGQSINPGQAYGGTLAGPIWKAAMEGALDGVAPRDFTDPDPDAIQGVPTEVPSVIGMSRSAAEEAIRDAGFDVAFGGTVDSGRPEGTIARQDPSGGTMWGSGQTVLIEASDGTPKPPPKPKPKPGDGDGDEGGDGGGDGDGGGGDGGGDGDGDNGGGGDGDGGGGNDGGDSGGTDGGTTDGDAEENSDGDSEN